MSWRRVEAFSLIDRHLEVLEGFMKPFFSSHFARDSSSAPIGGLSQRCRSDLAQTTG
jgi:hypothetical protein